MLSSLSSFQVVGLTIYGEARGELIEGQIAVANVIRNRVKKLIKQSYREVCFRRLQFSCWNENDPNRARLLELGSRLENDEKINNLVLDQCLWIGKGITLEYLLDNTSGADHYMTNSLYLDRNKRPSWANNMKVTRIIGNHTFLRA